MSAVKKAATDIVTHAVDLDSPTRIVLLPSFAQTGILALVCLETLECKTINFEVPTWVGDELIANENGAEHDDQNMDE